MIVESASLVAVAGASIVGSLHCGAMCGPLVGLYGPASTRLALVHALGRLVTYTALGVGAGAIGRAVDLAGSLGAVQHVASIIAALAIIAWGVRGFVRGGLDAGAGAGGGGLFSRGLVQVARRRPAARAAAIGMLTGLLPCGWLWAFVVVAGGTGSLTASAAVMAAFWLGTVPIMVGAMTFARPLLAKLRARVPRATSIALVAIGLVTLALRWRDAGAQQVYAPHCHHCDEPAKVAS